ncbi:MAG: hypothetical protein V5A68_01060, partial [Candidatus Thermoplasmatota archaeon]
AIEVGFKRSSRSIPNSNLADTWHISEISNPRVIAEYLMDIDLPSSTKVVVNQYKDKKYLKGLDVRKNSSIKGNYIVGDDRILVLLGPMKDDEIGVWTIEKKLVERLTNNFDKFWSQGKKIKLKENK